MSDAPWAVERLRGLPGELHALDPFEQAGSRQRFVMIMEPTTPALVLGSTQRPEVVEREHATRAGIDVVWRRSGGGAVLVRPGDMVWIDVCLRRTDPLWVDDVGRSAAWLAEVWQRALSDLGVEAVPATGPSRPGRWGDLVCFGGLGPGELTVDGRKVVGVSQRRTRTGARFQTSALLRWDPDALLDQLALSAADRARAASDLAATAAAVPAGSDHLVGAFLRHLP